MTGNPIKTLYLSDRFFQLFGALAVLFVLSFPVSFLLPVAQSLFALGIGLLMLDGYLLFRSGVRIEAKRTLPRLFSLGDPNGVRILLHNPSNLQLRVTVIDELPLQFQVRDFEKKAALAPGEDLSIRYELTPLLRGEYAFGFINLYLSSALGLLEKRQRVEAAAVVPVYPSILQMKKFELRALDKTSHQQGLKRIRRIGHSYEFDQIKNYVRGDDYRSINWKASGRRASLMVNQYEDERAQQVYSVIDKSRSMHMPFGGLSLMDHAINTSLVISNVVLQKHDRAGLITFSDKIGSTLKADSQPSQLRKILQALYREQERLLEANYELLYHVTRKLIHGRSLLLLFTNFESSYALERVLPVLRKINRFHLLVVIFFENTEVRDFAESSPDTLEGIYLQTVARKFLSEKAQMVQKLQQFGIQAVLTRPEELSVNTINKYLELKSRGLI